jgi:hypothetical protein
VKCGKHKTREKKEVAKIGMAKIESQRRFTIYKEHLDSKKDA